MATLDILKKAKDALDKAQASKKQSEDVLNSLGPAIIDALQPSLDENNRVMQQGLNDLAKAVSELKIEAPVVSVPQAQVDVKIPEIIVPTPQVTVNVADIPAPIIPEIKIPKITVPKPEVTVNVPPIKIPPLIWPSDEMPIKGWVQLMGVDLQHPLPVQVTNLKDFPGSSSSMVMGGGGGAATGNVVISGATVTVGVVTINPDGTPTYSVAAGSANSVYLTNGDNIYYNSDNPLPITGSITTSPAPQVSGYADSVNVMQYGGVATPTGKNETTDGVFRTIQMTDSVSSVYITGVAASTFAEIMNPDGRVKVELPTGSSGLTDTELRASPVPVQQVSGYSDSVNVIQLGGLAINLGAGTVSTGTQRVTLASNDPAVDSLGTLDNTVNAEDSGFSDQAQGFFILGVRNDNASTTTDTNVDFSQISTDSAGRVGITDLGGSITVDGSITASATDLDIRDLNVAQDEILAHQVSGSIWSVNVQDVFATTVASSVVNADNRVKVELSATALAVTQSGTWDEVGINDSGNSITVDNGGTFAVQVQDGQASSITSHVSGDFKGLDHYILGAAASTYSELLNADGRVKVELPATTVTVQDALTTTSATSIVNADNRIKVELPATTVTVQDAFTTTSASSMVNADNRVKVELPATTVTTTQSGSWAVQVQDSQASTISSHIFNTDFRGLDVYIGGSLNTTVSELASGDNRLKVDGSAVTQPISVTDIFATSATSNVVTPDNRVKVDGSGVTQPISGTVTVSGSPTSVIAVGVTLHDSADDGDAPLKTGGVAVQTNPTAVADGDRVRFTADDLGRQLTRPVNARDLIQTAYVSLTTGTETTLLSGAASTFFDLIYVACANQSDAATQVDLRSGTANGVVLTIEVPAQGTSGLSLSVPLPQDVAANAWTADLPDITGTTVTVSALFSKEK